MSLHLIGYVLKGALRDRLLISLLVLMVMGMCLSVFMGSSALIEKIEFSQVFAAGSLRMIGVFGLVLFTVFFIRRSFDSRDVDYILSRPVGRVQFLISYAAGFSVLALLTTIVQTGFLYILDIQNFGSGSLLWSFSMLAENIIMVNVSLFFAMLLSSPASAAMAVFGVYVLGRMMGQILGIMQADAPSGVIEGLEYTMSMVSVIVPRLDLMGQSAWLLYDSAGQVGFLFITLQAILFSALVIAAALIDLVKRQF